MSAVKFSRRFNGQIGQLTGNVDMASAYGLEGRTPFAAALQAVGSPAIVQAAAQRYTQALVGARTLLVMEVGGSPVWWGINWRPVYNSSTTSFEIVASEIWSYFQVQNLNINLDYTQQDQTSVIYKGLLDQAQTGANANIHLDTSLVVSGIRASGVLRDRHYLGTDQNPISQLCDQLSQVSNGFDHREDMTYDSGRIPHLWAVTGYPRLGRTWAGNPDAVPRFTFPGSIIDYQWPEDGLGMATRVESTSRDVSGNVTVAVTLNQPLLDAQFPSVQVHTAYDNLTADSGTLKEHCNSDALRRSSIAGIPRVTVQLEKILGYAVPGDDIRLTIHDWRFPFGIDAYFRLLGFDADVEQETAALILDTTVSAIAR